MISAEHMIQLRGLPTYWRYVLTGGDGDCKRAFEEGWNRVGQGHSMDDVIRIQTTPEPREVWLQRKMIGLGVITGEESNGLLVIDFDGFGSQAAKAFRRHFRHFLKELPMTAANMSGKHGRAKLYFHVGPSWWPQLRGKSATWRAPDGSVVLEALWNNTTENARHAVIAGQHPDSTHEKPLYYRWCEPNKRSKEGFSPEVVGVAEAPEWLVLGILAQVEISPSERNRQERMRSGDDDATPWERLSVAEKAQLVSEALPFCPPRLTKGSSTYPLARRVMCACINEFGLDWAIQLLANSDWSKKCDFGDSTLEKVMISLAKGRVEKDQQASISSVFYLAREKGWVSPQWAIPIYESKLDRDAYQKLINQAYEHRDDRPMQALLRGKAKRMFGVDADEFRRNCLDSFLGREEARKARSLQAIEDYHPNKELDSDLIDGFMARNVHILAGGSYSGKTTLACFLANRVITGNGIDVGNVRHSVRKPGRVLIATSDCSDIDMVRNLALEGITAEVAGDNLKIASGIKFDDMIELCKTITDFEPDLVIYDCLQSMSCAGVSQNDSAYADPIRLLTRHNGLAWPRCAHLILHHTRRDEPAAYSGTEQIKAAADELWLYYPPELMNWRRGQDRPQIGPTRHLVFEKSRTGYAGRFLAITRDPYQGHWMVTTKTTGGSALFQLAARFRNVTHDEWRISSEWAKELDLEYSQRTLRRYLDQLAGPVLERDRKLSKITGRWDTHYRPVQIIREAARAMISSPCDGVNIV